MGAYMVFWARRFFFRPFGNSVISFISIIITVKPSLVKIQFHEVIRPSASYYNQRRRSSQDDLLAGQQPIPDAETLSEYVTGQKISGGICQPAPSRVTDDILCVGQQPMGGEQYAQALGML
jgi:hypothetical protein